jgi:hypothetical protein
MRDSDGPISPKKGADAAHRQRDLVRGVLFSLGESKPGCSAVLITVC